jgi:PHP family Zn ribbon phosphoesterase
MNAGRIDRKTDYERMLDGKARGFEELMCQECFTFTLAAEGAGYRCATCGTMWKKKPDGTLEQVESLQPPDTEHGRGLWFHSE